MDDHRFDSLIRSISQDSSRRSALRFLLGAAAGSLLAVLGAPGARATHFGCRHVSKSCTRSRQCCSGRCRGPKGKKTCRAHDSGICTKSQDVCTQGEAGNVCGSSPGGACTCAITTGGAPYCASGTACFPCKKDTDTGCFGGTVPGAACIVCEGCQNASNPDGTACAQPCPDPTT